MGLFLARVALVAILSTLFYTMFDANPWAELAFMLALFGYIHVVAMTYARDD